MDKIVGIGELAISNNLGDKLKTFALASCVGVTVYSPIRKVAGMIHVALPNPYEKEDGDNNPSYYAHTGIPLLINKICLEYGCLKGELEINLYGGAESIRKNDVFNIGSKNISAVKKILWDMYLKFNAIEIGGRVSRTLEMDVDTGTVKVITQPIII